MKKVLYAILGLILVYLVLCLVGSKEFAANRSITIKAPASLVQAKMGDFKFFFEKWSPWTELDPAMKTTFEGEAGKPGHKYSWESDKKDVGKGSMALNAINGDSILMTLHFDDMGDSKLYYVIKEENGVTNVNWGMSGETGFIMRGMMLFMNMDKMMGPYFEKGLNKLKTEIESMPAEPVAAAYEVKEIQWEEKTFVGKRSTLTFDKMSAFFGENYPKIFADLGKAKIEQIMAPSAIYFKWDQEKGETDCAAVACVANGTKFKGWETWTIPASKVLQIAYYGAYEKSVNAHNAMDSYMKEKSLQQSLVIEEYVTDPMSEKDTTKWLTNIFYVVK